MSIECQHPRPALNMPSGSPARLRWQPPTYIPENLADLRRMMAEQYRAIYNELMGAQMSRAVVPLVDSLIQAQTGQIIQGIADGQTIVLPASVPGQLDDVRIILDDVVNPVTVVDPDGNSTTLAIPGVFDFTAANAQPYGTSAGGAVVGTGTFVVETADPVNLPAASEATDSSEIDWTFSGGFVTLAIINGSVALTRLQNQAAETFLGNFTASPAPPTARAGASVAGAGLTYTAGGTLAVGSSTSIAVNADDVQRAALTGDVTAAQNVNTTAFRSFTARSVLANATNASGVPTELQGSTAHHFLKVNAAGNGLVFEANSLAAFPTIADDTFLANISGATAVPSAVALTTLAGAGLTGGADAILNVGAGTRITVNANDVQLAAGAADSFLMNATAGSAVADYRAGTSVAGGGLTYTTGGTLAVGAGTRITVNADDVQLAAGAAESFLGNFTAGSAVADYRAGSSVAGAGLTYTAGGTLAVGSSTSITVNADDIQRSALTGDITASLNSNTTAFRSFAGLSVLARAGTTSGVPTELTAATANHLLKVNAAGTSLVFEALALAAFPTIADDTFLANISGATAVPSAVALTTLAGAGLTGGANAVLAVGAGDGIDVNADDVAVDVTDIVDGVSITEVATNNIQRAALTGDVTASAGSNATTIANNAVTDAKFRQSAGYSVVGRGASTTGNVADITAGTAGHHLVRNGTTAVQFSDPAGSGLTLATTGVLSVGGSTSIIVGATDVQRAALTGDVTASQNSNATTIANDAVTFAKMQNIATDSLIGRDTAGTGDPENITLNATLSMTGAGALQRAALTGDVTASAGSNSTTIANDAVTFAKMQNIAEDRLIGRDAVGTGDATEIALDGSLFFTGSTSIGVNVNGVANGHLAQMAAGTFKGRNVGAGTGNATDLPFASMISGTAATQSDQETASSTSTVVTPGRQQFHPSAAKFWVQHDTGTGLTSSYNVSSITDTGTGDHTVNINVDFSSTNWCPITDLISNSALVSKVNATGLAAGTVRQIVYTSTTAALADPSFFTTVGFGDQ